MNIGDPPHEALQLFACRGWLHISNCFDFGRIEVASLFVDSEPKSFFEEILKAYFRRFIPKLYFSTENIIVGFVVLHVL